MIGAAPFGVAVGVYKVSVAMKGGVVEVGKMIGLSDVVLVIETSDFAKVEQNLSRIGTVIARPPKSYQSNSPAGRKTGIDMLVYDPDGHVVEVSQVLTKNAK